MDWRSLITEGKWSRTLRIRETIDDGASFMFHGNLFHSFRNVNLISVRVSERLCTFHGSWFFKINLFYSELSRLQRNLTWSQVFCRSPWESSLFPTSRSETAAPDRQKVQKTWTSRFLPTLWYLMWNIKFCESETSCEEPGWAVTFTSAGSASFWRPRVKRDDDESPHDASVRFPGCIALWWQTFGIVANCSSVARRQQ